MPLTRKKKEALVDEMAETLEGATFVYLTDFSGLDVAQTNALRSRFFEAGVNYTVCKNTLLRLALRRLGGLDALADHLAGPTAVAVSEEPAAPARAIKDFLAEHDTEQPALKVAYIDGALYEDGDLDALAALKSKDELLGDILGLLAAPMANIVGGLQSPGSRLAGALQSMSNE